MKKVMFMPASEAVKHIPTGASIGTVGFMLTGAPEELFIEIEKSFLEHDTPRDLTLIWASGVGDGKDVRGLNHLAHKGLVKRTIAGHYGLVPKIGGLINDNSIEAYNFPQGVLTAMFREMSANRPGVLTRCGLGTFVDPDFEGGKMNELTKEDLVKKLLIEDEEYLLYKSQKINVALLRGTEADESGNIGFSEEVLKLENLSAAIAAKNNGGIVIVQVLKKVSDGEIDPRHISIPCTLVDIVCVVSDKKNHMQTAGTDFNQDFIKRHCDSREKNTNKKYTNIDPKMIIARRAALEIDKNDYILNYGIGIPEKVSEVLAIEGIENNFVATVEPGVIGGTACGGLDFGSAVNPIAIIEHPYQFDFYDGGGIDVTFLGMAQCNKDGSLNVSKFPPKIPGCGGFINISQNSKKIVFCGTFTAGNLDVIVENNKLKINQEGKHKKFVNKLDQITFNGLYEGKKNKHVLIVTERAVFKITEEGLELLEIAQGIDLEKDVLNQMEFKPIISDDLKLMDSKIFSLDKLNII